MTRLDVKRRGLVARAGMSLAESLIVVAIAVLLVTVVYKLLSAATKTGEEMTEEVKLLVDLRVLVEHMSRDVAAAHVILPPADSGADFKTSLTLARYNTEDAQDRLDTNNQNPVYPFFEPGSTSNTTVKLKCSRVRYLFDGSKREVTRTEEKGMLEGKPSQPSGSGQKDLRIISDYNFTVESAVTGPMKGPIRNVNRFDVSYMFYDDKGQAKLATAATEVFKTACIGLNLRATQDQNLYAREAGKQATRRQPTVELATKFWSQRKLSEVVYPEYFSSTDDDLRY